MNCLIITLYQSTQLTCQTRTSSYQEYLPCNFNTVTNGFGVWCSVWRLWQSKDHYTFSLILLMYLLIIIWNDLYRIGKQRFIDRTIMSYHDVLTSSLAPIQLWYDHTHTNQLIYAESNENSSNPLILWLQRDHCTLAFSFPCRKP